MKFLVIAKRVLGVPVEKIAAVLPAEYARADELVKEGIIEQVYLAAGQKGGVLIMNVDSAEALHQALESLPMYPYLDIAVTPLVPLPS